VNITILNPLLTKDWDKLILQHPEATFFHSSAWADVLSKTYQHEPQYIGCFRKNELLALVPMMEIQSRFTGCRGVGLPFTDRCAPLLFHNDAFELVLHSLSDLARKRSWKHFELRGGIHEPSIAAPSVRFYEHILDLRKSSGGLFSNFSSANRRAIRKAERSEIRLETSDSPEAIRKYYQLHVRTRKRHGLPPQPFSFFDNIQKSVIETGMGFVTLAYIGVVPIAGAVFFHFGRSAIYKFGASDENFHEHRVNNLLMWKGIEALRNNGFEQLYFGRTSWNNPGLRKYKLGWGTEEKTLTYLKFNTLTKKWEEGRDRTTGFHNVIFSKLPPLLNCLAGAMIYPHLD